MFLFGSFSFINVCQRLCSSWFLFIWRKIVKWAFTSSVVAFLAIFLHMCRMWTAPLQGWGHSNKQGVLLSDEIFGREKGFTLYAGMMKAIVRRDCWMIGVPRHTTTAPPCRRNRRLHDRKALVSNRKDTFNVSCPKKIYETTLKMP